MLDGMGIVQMFPAKDRYIDIYIYLYYMVSVFIGFTPHQTHPT